MKVDRVARPSWFDSRLSSEWSQIQRELRVISDTYRYSNRGGGWRRDDGYRRRNQNDDWRRRVPFPFPR